MDNIRIKKTLSVEEQEQMGLHAWPIWEKEESEFSWEYSEQETCYIISGRVIVTPDGSDPVEIEAGDFVTFPRGMACRWDIKEKIRKHFKFG